jgi:hypothetical protein
MAYGTLNAGTITPGSGNTLAISEAVTVPTPTATTHATTKAYVDSAATQATTAAQGVGTGNAPTFAGLTSTQNIVMSDGKGIDYSAYTDGSVAGTTNSQVLDDYEEGTWTPVITGSTGGTGTQSGSGAYTKIGNVVYFRGSAVLSSKTGITGSMNIAGLPFTVGQTGAATIGTLDSIALPSSCVQFGLMINNATTTLTLRASKNNAVSASVTATEMSNTSGIQFTGFSFV